MFVCSEATRELGQILGSTTVPCQKRGSEPGGFTAPTATTAAGGIGYVPSPPMCLFTVVWNST